MIIKMIAASNGNIHDIDHLLRVWAYARTIGELEGLDAETQYLLEVAAITHDIACPLCREKYGNANGKYQEQEGAVLVRSFLADTGMTEAQIARVAYLVGHHHTLRNIHGPDYQILIEADYIANASENGYGKQSVMHFMDTVMKTASGKHLAACTGIKPGVLGGWFRLCLLEESEENLRTRYAIIRKQREEAKATVKYMEDKAAHYEAILAGLESDDTNPKNWTAEDRPEHGTCSFS